MTYRYQEIVKHFFSSPNHWILHYNTVNNKDKDRPLNFNLNDLSVGQSVGCSVTLNGELHCYVDGKFQCVGWTGLPTDIPYWGVADVYANTTKIKSEFVFSKFIDYYDIYIHILNICDYDPIIIMITLFSVAYK